MWVFLLVEWPTETDNSLVSALSFKRRINFAEGKKEEGSTVDDSKPYKCQHCSVSMDTQNELDEHNESKYSNLLYFQGLKRNIVIMKSTE